MPAKRKAPAKSAAASPSKRAAPASKSSAPSKARTSAPAAKSNTSTPSYVISKLSSSSSSPEDRSKFLSQLIRSSYVATTLYPALAAAGSSPDAAQCGLLVTLLKAADADAGITHSSVVTGGILSFVTPSTAAAFPAVYAAVISADSVSPADKLWLLSILPQFAAAAGPAAAAFRSCIETTASGLLLKSLPPSLLEYHVAVTQTKPPAAASSDAANATSFQTLTTQFLDLAKSGTPGEAEDVAFAVAYVKACIALLSSTVARNVMLPYLTYNHVLPLLKTTSLSSPSLTKLLPTLSALVKSEDNKGDVSAQLQRIAHSLAPTVNPILKGVAMATISDVQSPKYLTKTLGQLEDDELATLANALRLIAPEQTYSKEVVISIFLDRFARKYIPMPHPVFSTETSLFAKENVETLPHLGTQFVNYDQYFTTSFKLYQADANDSIKDDLIDVVRRSGFTLAPGSSTISKKGWSRYGADITSCKVTKKGKIKIGTRHHSEIEAVAEIDLMNYAEHVRAEWDSLGENDVIFLLTVIPSDAVVMNDKDSATSAIADSIKVVRGGTIVAISDGDGNEISGPETFTSPTARPKGASTKRIFKLHLDPVQYHEDHVLHKGGKITDEALYGSINLIVRRSSKENNFKAVLETIDSLRSDYASNTLALPSWLNSVILGYGNVDSVHYSSDQMRRFSENTPGLPKPGQPMDFGDAFVDEKHLKESFPEQKVSVVKNDSKLPFYTLSFDRDDSSKITATPYTPKLLPNPVNLKFTPTQISAVKSCLHPGLSLIVGPPGTGKTDVATHVISCLHRTYPTQRIVVIAHSNAALNDLFEKIMARGDIDERFMIRLGSGERDLKVDSTHDFSKRGRVAYTLARRELLLKKVQDLSESLGVSTAHERGPNGESSYTCETAMLFYKHQVSARIEIFERTAVFPFAAFFNNDASDAKAKFEKLKELFEELEDFRAFELLRSNGKRSDYLMAKQAKIVAMTCTHAALARKRLLELDFKYDSVIVEEAGQMLEIESFIPLLLQNKTENGGSRLKRVCLFGDHNQLPPIIKNRELAKHGNFDQSFFSRMIRLGVKHLTLDQQGRAREEISALYSWRYGGLGSLAHTKEGRFTKANAGFAKTMQFINVEDYEGRGEHCPSPYYYQNLGEAEFVVAVYQYMVLLGYPPEKISILTTYNGQRDLIMDVLNRRCGPSTVFAQSGRCTVSTVDKYQGQQNDYILLSLVRTGSVGHLQDVRRLIVALSRAKLGLYVFGRRSVFGACSDLKESMEQFDEAKGLELVQGEGYAEDGVARTSGTAVKDKAGLFVVEDIKTMGEIVHGMQLQIVQAGDDAMN
jgi:intron-binding protein aquarius